MRFDKPYLFLVAVMDHRIVGFCHTVKPGDHSPDFDCEIKAIYVDPNHQRLGIGQALVSESVRRFVTAGFKAMIIWAATENPWRRFYEKIGGTLLPHTKQPEIGGKPVPHVAYGWRDLSILGR